MTLSNKLAFEIWVGIIVLVIVIGGVAGVVLMVGNNKTASLARTQANSPVSSAAPLPEKVAVSVPPEPSSKPSFSSRGEIMLAAKMAGSLFAP